LGKLSAYTFEFIGYIFVGTTIGNPHTFHR